MFFHLIDTTDPHTKQRLEQIKAKGEEPGLKVIGVGYGRTGTFSLTVALEELGYPTLHTQHLYEYASIMDMWAQRVFMPSIQQNKILKGNPDFDTIANAGFQATTDLPMALYFEEILERYPDCKFILTTRESSEIWFRSWDAMTSMIKQPAAVGSFLSVPHVIKLGYYMRWLFSTVSQDAKFLTAPFPLPGQNKERSIKSYETHNRRVRQIIPPQNLLEYNVKQGYAPLCQFLDVPKDQCPTQPFPKSNSARSVKVQAISSILFTLTVTIFVICMIFRKITGSNVLPWLRRHRTLLSRKEKLKLSTKNMDLNDHVHNPSASTSSFIHRLRQRISPPQSPTTVAVATVPVTRVCRKNVY